MGCFSTCFRKSNRRRSNRSRRVNRHPCLIDQLQKDDFLEPLQVHKSIEQESVEKPMDPIPESRDEEKEKENSSGRKKVTFDLNVKIYEQVEQTNEEEGDENKEKEEEETAAADSYSSQCHSDSSNSSSLFSYPPNYRYQNCRDSDDELASDDASDVDDDDDGYLEDEEEEDGDGDVDVDEVNNEVLVENESSGSSLFSLSITSRNQKFGAENSNKEEVNSPMLIKNPCCRGELQSLSGLLGLDKNQAEGERTKIVIDSVLNPVENLDQWHAVKARAKLTAASKRQSKSKENINGGADPRSRMTPRFKTREEEEDPQLNFQKQKSIESKQEIITVDTSLSSWLGVSEATATTPNSGAGAASSDVNSVGNYSSVLLSDDRIRRSSPRKYEEDRPILGALTVEEIKQFSATSSPCRRSPSRSPDDMPIIGTVGSYWSHTGQGSSANDKTESAGSVSSTTRRIKYTEDDKVYWNPIPFETRLETALQKGIPQA